MDAVVCGHKSYNGIRDEFLGQSEMVKEDMLPTLELYVSAWWMYDIFVNVFTAYILYTAIHRYFTSFVVASEQPGDQGIYDPQL